MILLQTDDAPDPPHKDIDNDEVISDAPPTVRVPSNDNDGNQNKSSASVCL